MIYQCDSQNIKNTSFPFSFRRSLPAGKKGLLILFLMLLLFLPQRMFSQNYTHTRETLLFDRGWKFHLGDASNPAGDFGYGTAAVFAKAGESTGAIKPEFNDSTWRTVDLPHDWANELDFVQSKNPYVRDHGYKPVGRLFPATSIGWYRRSFLVSTDDSGKRIVVRFDGVFRDCKVWLNGHYIGNNMSGYSGFQFDITDYIWYGKKNTLVVRADATQYEGWFYEGTGIYRHVWLEKYNPVHIPENGVFVHTQVKGDAADVFVETSFENQQGEAVSCSLTTKILDAQNNVAGEQTLPQVLVPVSQQNTVKLQLSVKEPRLWSLETPYLYKLVSIVKINGIKTDSVTTPFGIRTILFDKDKGFFLNGKHIKLLGVCCHQDHAGVGSALPDRLEYYRIAKLKEMGCNAYRTSHNPPNRELLEACDKLGMLVMDENRLMGSSPEMMGQFEKLILRDRTHPSVIIWSIGNEEYVIQGNETGRRIAQSLMTRQRELDPTRLCTYAGNNGNEFTGINGIMPVRGFNYMNNNSDIDKYRQDHPDQVLLGSEEGSTVCTRGIYTNDTIRGYVSDYDINVPDWGARAEDWWKFYSERDWLAGAFVWTGFDYRGEPTPYNWPCINSHFGIMDMCGYPKTNYYYYQAWWTDKDVLHLAPHWNWKGREGDTIQVWCETNCKSVELFLNGKSLGTKQVAKNSHLEWKVKYQPGILEARGVKNNKTLTTRIETTGNPSTIRLTPDRESILGDGEDVVVADVTVLDANGKEVPDASNMIRFEVQGAGRIIGVANGDPSCHEADVHLDGNYSRSLFNGKCQVLIQSDNHEGMIIVRASAEGIEPASVSISASRSPGRPSVGIIW